MENKNVVLSIVAVLVLIIFGYFNLSKNFSKNVSVDIDPTPKEITLLGVYECLPFLGGYGANTNECAFGLKTDDGVYYAVNFGQSADAMKKFQNGERIYAQGFFVPKEALSTDHWVKYNMKGIFTITKMLPPLQSQGKLNINVVCEEALSYMTFENGKKADEFVVDCKEGKHPEVIERYKERMGLGDGKAI
jgi:hypothetical protein